MSDARTNLSSSDGPAYIDVISQHLVLLDPLALDMLPVQLPELSRLDSSSLLIALSKISKDVRRRNFGLRIGWCELPSLSPRTYTIDANSFDPVEPDDTHEDVFDIDCGTVVVVDVSALGAVAATLTWERYDLLLQQPIGDSTLIEEMIREVGGKRFAIVSGDINYPFAGDGIYRFREGMPKCVS